MLGSMLRRLMSIPHAVQGDSHNGPATAFPLFPLPPILLLMHSSPNGHAVTSPSTPQTQQTRTGYIPQACPSFHRPRWISNRSHLPLLCPPPSGEGALSPMVILPKLHHSYVIFQCLSLSLSSSASLLCGLSSSPTFESDKCMSQM
jgi:hypothetical protein